MNNPNDFVIENGVLKKYNGKDPVVTVPDGVTSIGDSAFSYCRNLTSVTLPEGLTSIRNYAFYECSSLNSVALPEGLTSIGNYAFEDCSSLTSVTLPEGLTSIGYQAFYGCKSLKSVTLPEGLTSIGDSAFWGCSSLTSVTLPESLTSIGDKAFCWCSSLKSVTLPEGLTSIGDSAFSYCRNLTSVTLPEGLTSIGNWAFSYCSSLTSVTLPEGLTSIGNYAFEDCSSLTSVTLPKGLTSIGERAFYRCASLTSVTLPEGLTSIGNEVFSYCSSLNSVALPEGLTSIGNHAFYGCKSLKSVTLPEGLTSIGDRAFRGCKKLAGENGFVIVDGILFDYAGQGGDIALPEGLTSIGHSAFYECKNLTGVTLPEGLTSIGEEAFKGCSSLTSVTLPEGLTSIGEEAFKGCCSLSGIVLSDTLPSLGKNAFAGCGGVECRIKKPKALAAFLKKHGFSAAFVKGMESNGILPLEDVIPAVLGYVLTYPYGEVEKKDYKKAALESYVKNPAAEEAAAKLDHDKLMALLKLFMEKDSPKAAARWDAPYAAYANEEELTELLSEMKEWEKDTKKKEQLIRVRGAIMLNDTVTAMRYADSLGLLERYAALRGLDADTLRDETVSDFGLDLSGRRTWSLAGKTITATLNNDLTFTLTDESGKELKSVPKKGADEAEYETVKKEFAALKKDVKATAKTRNDKIFADFLSGRARPAEAWKNGYLDNAVLIALARLIVWAQGKKTFTLKETGELITVDGAAYTLTDEPVKVAHPMEMRKADVEAWQRYFTSNALKQPFEQVWEPVADASLVKPGRYDGCTVPLYALMNKDKHGIIMEGRSQITLKDCSADLIYIEGHHDWVNNEFEVKNFKFKEYTRQVNHIVVHLDKATVAGRIKKDDVSASQWFDRFTLAQIQSFIDLANENKATNVLALLLEYKEKTFPDFDPMAEFTLEW